MEEKSPIEQIYPFVNLVNITLKAKKLRYAFRYGV